MTDTDAGTGKSADVAGTDPDDPPAEAGTGHDSAGAAGHGSTGHADGADGQREVDPGANVPERPGVANLVDALNVRRNAAVGFGIGVLFTLFVVYVSVIVPDRPYSLGLWATLGFVLAVGTGLLLSAVFTLGSAFRRARELD